MFRHYKLLFALFAPGIGFAQGLRNDGANIVISSGSNIYIDGTTGHYTNKANGLIKNSTEGGKFILTGNWVNEATSAFSNDGTTVVLNGAGAQGITGATAFYNLTAQGGGTKTVNSPSTISKLLTMGASTTLNANNNLTLLATNTTNANVATIPSGASVTGNVKVQTYFTGGNSTMRGNRLVSAPVNDATSPKGTYAQLKDYVIITGPGNTVKGFDMGGAKATDAITLQKYYEPGTATTSYTNIASITESLSPANAVIMYYRGDRSGFTNPATSAKTNAPFSVPETTLMQWNGPINQGSYTVNLTYTVNPGEPNVSGLNLVGNPYPAYIDWEKLTKTNIANYIRFIKPGGGFAMYKLSGGSYISINSNNVDLRIIPPGQGFYVYATGANSSITFTEASKSVESTSIARLLYNPQQDKLLLNGAKISATSSSNPAQVSASVARKLLRMNLQDAWNTEETVALFVDGESAGVTTEDATFPGGSSISLATLSSEDTRLTINAMPSLNQVSSMKLYVYSATAGSVKLNFTDLSAVQGYNVYLKDAYTNATVDVKANPSYEFAIDPAIAATYGNNRMSLWFSQATTLPVALSTFKAEKVASGAKVIWNVKSEDNVVRYEVERSSDGVSFAKIKEVSDLGKSTYSVIDESPVLSQNYYRLKSVDADGRTDFSNVISLDYSLSNEVNVNVFPNPASDVVKVKLPSAKAVSLAIYDLNGKKLKSTKFTSSTQVQENITDLSEGVYVIEVRDSATEAVLVSSKFIVKK
ncbi:T9SS type A sorting domain-containing protein [Desertivirga arenae]|uniref:T9SS type A sorting domain-containing protein n=1 Tax=Desertivirga arenae TaxID=2810309 RepID=UPI001A96301F|nr:T9SS type A sorting domain-containing protein [Pedobacter sp. SYSU D00823]